MTIHKSAGQAKQQAGLSQAATQSHKTIVARRGDLTDKAATDAAAVDMEDFAARMERLSRLDEAMGNDIFSDFDSPEDPPAAEEEVAVAETLAPVAAEEIDVSEPAETPELPAAQEPETNEDLDLDALDALGADEDEDLAADEFGGADLSAENLDALAQDEIEAPLDQEETSTQEEADQPDEATAPSPEEALLDDEAPVAEAADDVQTDVMAEDVPEAPEAPDAPDTEVEAETEGEAPLPQNTDLDEGALDAIFGDNLDDPAEMDEAPAAEEMSSPEVYADDADLLGAPAATESEDALVDEPITFEPVDAQVADRNAQISEEIVEAQAAAEIEEAESTIDEADDHWGLPADEDLAQEADPFGGEPAADTEDDPLDQMETDFPSEAPALEEEEPVDYRAKNVPSDDAGEDNAQNVQSGASGLTMADERDVRASESEEEDMANDPLDAMLKARAARRDEVDLEADDRDAPQAAQSEYVEQEYEEAFAEDGEVPFEADGKAGLKRKAIIGAGALVIVGVVAVGAMGMMGSGEPNGGTSIAPPSPITKKVVDATSDDPVAAQAPVAQDAPKVETAQADTAADTQAPADAETPEDGATGTAAADTGAADLAAQIPLPDNASFDPSQSSDMNDVIAGLQKAGSGDMSDVAGADELGSDAAIKKALVGYTTTEQFNLVKDQMAEMKAAIAKMNGALTDKDTKIADLQKAVTAAQSEASNAKKLAIAQNDLMVKVVRMGEKVETGEKLIVDLSKRVAKLEAVDPADKAEVKTQLDDVMQRLDGLSRDVSMVARVAINGTPDMQSGAAVANGGSNADPTSVYSTDKPLPKPPADHGKVPSDVKKGDFVKGYGAVLDIVPTSGGARLVVMENGSVLIK